MLLIVSESSAAEDTGPAPADSDGCGVSRADISVCQAGRYDRFFWLLVTCFLGEETSLWCNAQTETSETKQKQGKKEMSDQSGQIWRVTWSVRNSLSAQLGKQTKEKEKEREERKGKGKERKGGKTQSVG